MTKAAINTQIHASGKHTFMCDYTMQNMYLDEEKACAFIDSGERPFFFFKKKFVLEGRLYYMTCKLNVENIHIYNLNLLRRKSK